MTPKKFVKFRAKQKGKKKKKKGKKEKKRCFNQGQYQCLILVKINRKTFYDNAIAGNQNKALYASQLKSLNTSVTVFLSKKTLYKVQTKQDYVALRLIREYF